MTHWMMGHTDGARPFRVSLSLSVCPFFCVLHSYLLFIIGSRVDGGGLSYCPSPCITWRTVRGTRASDLIRADPSRVDLPPGVQPMRAATPCACRRPKREREGENMDDIYSRAKRHTHTQPSFFPPSSISKLHRAIRKCCLD